MVCSALRGLFVYRTELKRPVDRYHPPCSLSCAACWGISLRFVVSCVYAVGGAYTQKLVYTRGGTYTHPLCIRTTARVNAPTRVYAPGCVYAPAA